MGYICTRCGGTKVACEAIVNPNTREIIDYFDESFAHAISWKKVLKTGMRMIMDFTGYLYLKLRL